MITNLFMGLILMIALYFTGGLGLGLIFVIEYCRKKTKENTGKENEMLFFILGMIIYMLYQFLFYIMIESEDIASFYWSILGSWIYFELFKIAMSKNIKKTGGDMKFFDKNKSLLYSMLVIFCIINIIVYECIK